ncbi:MAG: isoaspartyl peptidase/L-asparaginase family protein [Adhaeribacter sp.]
MSTTPQQENFVIVVHGGAEDKSRQEIGPEKEKAYRQGLQQALQAGWVVLERGGTALEAVEAAVGSLEDNPLFNAARGAALSQDGKPSFDAAIMDGKTLEAGAVMGVTQVKNPVRLARRILEESGHVALSGAGALDFARKKGLELEPEAYFITPEKVAELKESQGQSPQGHDTIGALALDKAGNLAAATSTGGLTGQLPGRIGDSPLIGCGTYANNEVCAVSCTGDGESIIRGLLAAEVYALVKYLGLPLAQAARRARETYPDKIKKDRNLIALSPQGEVALEFETQLMFRGYRKGHAPAFVAIWDETDA